MIFVGALVSDARCAWIKRRTVSEQKIFVRASLQALRTCARCRGSQRSLVTHNAPSRRSFVLARFASSSEAMIDYVGVLSLSSFSLRFAFATRSVDSLRGVRAG